MVLKRKTHRDAQSYAFRILADIVTFLFRLAHQPIDGAQAAFLRAGFVAVAGGVGKAPRRSSNACTVSACVR